MAFSESIKKESRRKSAFTCCVCQRPGVSVEVHHIIPQEENGPDTLENAVVLCPSCHGDLGSNPEKRTRIKEMRDWWYETVEKMYNPGDIALLKQISNSLEDLPDIKKTLSELVSQKINQITPRNASIVVSSILSSASAAVSGVGLKTVYDDEPTPEEIDRAGDAYISNYVDRMRGK